MRFVLILLALLVLSGCGKRPAAAGGKPASFWVAEMQDKDPLKRKTAVHKLGNRAASEPSGFPTVLAALRDPDGRVRQEAVAAVLKYGARPRRPSPP